MTQYLLRPPLLVEHKDRLRQLFIVKGSRTLRTPWALRRAMIPQGTCGGALLGDVAHLAAPVGHTPPPYSHIPFLPRRSDG